MLNCGQRFSLSKNEEGLLFLHTRNHVHVRDVDAPVVALRRGLAHNVNPAKDFNGFVGRVAAPVELQLFPIGLVRVEADGRRETAKHNHRLGGEIEINPCIVVGKIEARVGNGLYLVRGYVFAWIGEPNAKVVERGFLFLGNIGLDFSGELAEEGLLLGQLGPIGIIGIGCVEKFLQVYGVGHGLDYSWFRITTLEFLAGSFCSASSRLFVISS